MASESFFDNTAFFHTPYGMLHFNPDSGNPLVLLFFKAVSSFPFGFFLGMHISTPSGLCPMKPVSCQSLIPLGSRRGSSSQIFLSWTWPSYVELSHTILRLLVHSRLFFMLWVFFTTIACRLPVFIQRALNRSLGSCPESEATHWSSCCKIYVDALCLPKWNGCNIHPNGTWKLLARHQTQQELILSLQALGYDGGESCRNTSIELFRPQR